MYWEVIKLSNKIYDVFEKIQAEESLKISTISYLNKELQRRNKPQISYVKKRISVIFVIVVMFILLGGSSFRMYYTPNVFIDMDINPSIELIINSFNKVIGVNAYNEDGEKILLNIDVKYKSYDNAIGLLLETMNELGYLTKANLISVTVQSNNKEKESTLLNELALTVNGSLYSESKIETNIFAVSEETKTHANENCVSPAKYLAILELQEVDPYVTIESCRSHTISELKQLTEEHECGIQNHDSEEHKRGNDHEGGHHH